jgi:hypothetical protein
MTGPAPLVPCACGCGGLRPATNAYGRPRRYIQGHRTRRTPTPVPEILCGCGCGRSIPSRDRFGRSVRYVKGHHPRRHPLSCTDAVLSALADSVERSFTEVVKRSGAGRKAVASALRRLRNHGRVDRVQRGVWRLQVEWSSREYDMGALEREVV